MHPLNGALVLHIDHPNVLDGVAKKFNSHRLAVHRVQVENIATAAELTGVHNHAGTHIAQRQTAFHHGFRGNHLPMMQMNRVGIQFRQR